VKNVSRILTLTASAILGLMFILPIWNISLKAPQYPEGLGLNIYVSSIKGVKQNDLNSINNLNHYIGMKKIIPDSIPELKIMPYIILSLIILGLICVLVNKRWLTGVWVSLFIIVGFIGMYDFYMWEYDYGHNLSPKAIIKIPGQYYQLPLFGTEQLLNFTANSYPGPGGMIAGLSIILGIISIFIYNKKSKKGNSIKNAVLSLIFIPLLFLFSCSPSPKPIEYGFDKCDKCKMTISDFKWGAEIVTNKGKIYKFDDVECMAAFYWEAKKTEDDRKFHSFWTVNYLKPGELIDAQKTQYLKSTEFHSPMAFNAASFSTELDRKNNIKTQHDIYYDWQGLLEAVRGEWSDNE
jgi:copper chaperone NosL